MAATHSKHARPRPKRKKPVRLAEKLLTIRQRLKLSQDGLIRHLGLEDEIERDYVSKFERGVLEPTLDVLLEYARAMSTTGQGEFLETLIDDTLNLPVNLPTDPSSHLRTARRKPKVKTKKNEP